MERGDGGVCDIYTSGELMGLMYLNPLHRLVDLVFLHSCSETLSLEIVSIVYIWQPLQQYITIQYCRITTPTLKNSWSAEMRAP